MMQLEKLSIVQSVRFFDDQNLCACKSTKLIVCNCRPTMFYFFLNLLIQKDTYVLRTQTLFITILKVLIQAKTLIQKLSNKSILLIFNKKLL